LFVVFFSAIVMLLIVENGMGVEVNTLSYNKCFFYVKWIMFLQFWERLSELCLSLRLPVLALLLLAMASKFIITSTQVILIFLSLFTFIWKETLLLLFLTVLCHIGISPPKRFECLRKFRHHIQHVPELFCGYFKFLCQKHEI